MTELLKINEVLELVNNKFDYLSDMYSKLLLRRIEKKIELPEDIRYAVPSRAFRKYIDEYINRTYKNKYGEIPLKDEDMNKIIYKEGSTKGQKYHKKDIIKMLNDRKVREKIKKRIDLKSFALLSDSGTQYVPTELWNYYNKTPPEMNYDENYDYYEIIKEMNLEEIENELDYIEEKRQILHYVKEEKRYLSFAIINAGYNTFIDDED